MDPLYSKLGLKYQQAYSGHYYDMRLRVGNSRLVCSMKNHALTGFGRPMISIGSQKEILPKFKKLYYECKGLWYMDYLESGSLSDIGLFLVKDGLNPIPYYTQIVNLRDPDNILHENLRKSYKSLVNKYTPIETEIKTLQRIHLDVAGRETRPRKTWEIQQEMIDNGEAFCLAIPDAAALFLYSKDTCYYGVAASRGVDSHSIIWKAILKAKELGCKWFELGQQHFDGDEKLKQIAKFKRGFGGMTKVRMEFRK